MEQKKLVAGPNANRYSTISGTDVENPLDQEPQAQHTDFLRTFVFGGVDGLFTSLVLISAGAGGHLSLSAVVIFSIAALCAVAFVTGFSEYFASRAHREFLSEARKRATWEFTQNGAEERKKMTDDFVRRGMSVADAQLVVSKLAQSESLFVDMVLAEEIGSRTRNEDDEYILSDAFIMFVSHIGFGLLPLLALVFMLIRGDTSESASEDKDFVLAGVCALLLLFVLGAIKGAYNTLSGLYTGLECLLVGTLGASVAFFGARLCWNTFIG